MNAKKNWLRRTMMFLNAQRPSLMKDAYIYRPDSVILDLEDAVADRGYEGLIEGEIDNMDIANSS